MQSPSANSFCLIIRPLNAADSPTYRALRQRILNSEDARYFSDSYEREEKLSESQWLDWCTEKTEHCILGTFANDELVGIIMVTRQGGLESPVVEWEAAWLDPRYRRMGIGKTTYEQARQWSLRHNYKYVAGFIRATYTPALDICKDQGFEYIYTIPSETWADGSVSDTRAFLLDLRPEATKHASKPIFERFEEALPYLYQGLHAPITLQSSTQTQYHDSAAA